MSKKNHKFILLSLIILTLFIGLSQIYQTDFFEASAEEHEYPMTIRNATTETTMLTDKKGITRMGLPVHIQNNQGEYIANLVYEDSSGIELESGTISYFFDKNSCAMTLFNAGRINNETSYPILKGDMWVVKVAPNGTDNWQDIPQNNLPCTITTDIQSKIIKINSTKSDVNGTISEIYQYDLYKGLKHDMYFTNNNPDWNDHKFSFSNILQETPKSFSIFVVINQTSGTSVSEQYSVYPSDSQPYKFGGTANILNTTHGETIQYNYTDFIWNGTQITDGFTLLQRQSEPIFPDIGYEFGSGFDKLWSVKFISNSDSTLDVYIDYANVTSTLPIGNTMNLDPIFNSLQVVDRRIQRTLGSSCHLGSGAEIAAIPTVFRSTDSAGKETCQWTYTRYDISEIPDNATPIRGTLSFNVTGGFNSYAATVNPNQEPHLLDGSSFFDEDIITLSSAQFVNAISQVASTPKLNTLGRTHWDFDLLTSANTFSLVPIQKSVSRTLITDFFIIEFEAQLESGKNYWQIVLCRGGTLFGCDSNLLGPRSTSLTYEEATSFFEVEWELTDPPDAPQDVTATFSTTPDKCTVDWEPPLFNGGRVVTGFQIERSSGAGFGIIVADTGTVIPTQFDDTTVVAGLSFTYRVSAINAEGVGTASEVSNGCGVPEISSQPVGLVASNVALNIVALDWSTATFDGNTPPTGYVIERTTGSPTSQSDTWDFLGHRIDPIVRPPFVGTGFGQFIVPTQTVDGIFWNNPNLGNRKTMWYFFQTFDKDEINGRPLFVDWAGTTVGASGQFYHVQLLDGVYDRFSNTDFAIFSCGLGGFGADPTRLCIPLKGIGLIHNFQRILGAGTSFSVFEEPFGVGFLMDTTSAFDSSGKVTLFVRMSDAFVNNFPSNGGTMTIRSIEIEGMEKWDFGAVPIGDTIVDESGLSTCAGGINNCGTVTVGNVEGTNQGFVRLVRDTGTLLTEFIDNTVTQLTNFGYRVSQINSEGTSLPSLVATIFTIGLPESPINLVVTPTGTTTIDISWEDGNLSGGTVAFYTLERKTGVGGIFTTIFIDPNKSFNDAFLSPSTEFCYRVKVTTNAGESPFSDEVCATTFDAPSEPLNLIATAIDGSTINVQWDTPASDGGSEITGYKIERQKQANPFQILFSERQPESNRILNDTNLEIGTTFTYRIKAINQFGEGDQALASATTDATPQAPPNFQCSPAGSTSVLLTWTAPQTFSPPTGYQIDRKEFGDGGFSTIVADTGTTATTFLDETLSPDQLVVYRVLGKTSEGDTDFSSEINCSPLTAPDFPPENVRGDFSEVVPHQTVLAWDIPDTFGIPITEFRIERDDSAGFSTIASVSGSSIAFIDQALDNDINQSYRIITVGTEGESAPTIAVPFDTNQTSHWHYENTIDDTGFNKNSGTLFGTPNFNGTGHIGKGFIFDGLTRIQVDPTQESDYDFDRLTDFGITTYYRGTLDGGIQANTFGFTSASTDGRVFGNGITGSACGISSFTKEFLQPDVATRPSNLAVQCIRAFAEFDISSISNSSNTITGIGFRIDIGVGVGTNTRTCDFNSLEVQPSIGSAANVWNDIEDGTNFLTNVGNPICENPPIVNNAFIDLGSSAVSDMQSAFNISQPWWGVGWKNTNETRIVESDAFIRYVDNSSEIQINFTSPTGTNESILISKSQTLTDIGYKFYIDQTGNPSVKLTNTDLTNEIFVKAPINVTDNTLHFIGFGYNGNGTASGISMNVDGSPITPTIIIDNLSGSILNNNPLTIGATSTGTNFLNATLDETRIFGTGSLDENQLNEIANDELQTIAPINATMTIAGSTFANISAELVTIQLVSGFPIPAVGIIDLNNFTVTIVNTITPTITIDPLTGEFIFDRFFNPMGSLSNYTADTTLTNTLEAFPLLSNFDIQTPVFTFLGDFFFQQARNPTFDILSFNFTSTKQPFDLSCNLKSELFEDGTTFDFTNVFFVQALFDVPPQTDIVVACIDPSIPPIDPTAPSFGGSNALLSFVSFGGNTGIGNFLQFTANYGDFFGAGLPFLFIIILAAAFTGRSAPTGIIIIGISLGAMWFLGIIEQDPVMWGIIIVLIVLGALGGKKFL